MLLIVYMLPAEFLGVYVMVYFKYDRNANAEHVEFLRACTREFV